MRLRLAFFSVMAALSICPAALASEMQYTPASGPTGSGGETNPPELRFVADPGEVNRLSVVYDQGSYRFIDMESAIRPGPCTASGPNVVRCTGITPEFGSLVIRLGDRDDEYAGSGPGPGPVVDGGDGADSLDARGLTGTASAALFGGAGDDRLFGSPSSSSLSGGAGADMLRGGDGVDALDGGTGADSIDGGLGNDTLTYAGTAPVRVDLGDPGPDGAAGENDTLTGVENVTVLGKANDVLIGDDGPNRLVAGAGANRVDGRGGADSINVGDRRDRVSGGDGDDVIDANGKFLRNRAHAIACGAGSDLVRAPGSSDILERDCERVEYLYFLMSARPVALDTSRGIAAFRWSVECADGYRCSALLALHSGRTLLGQAYPRVGGGTQRFHVHLTRAGRAFARSGRTSRVQVSVRRDRRRTSGGRVGRGETRTYGIRGLAPLAP